MTDFQRDILAGIPDPLPAKRAYDPQANHAPKRKDILTDEQKKIACQLSEEAGADFVKTSTGYGSKGCTIDDLKLMRAAVSANVRVKGSGGIRDLDTVLAARAIGASRCGVSATVKIMEEAKERLEKGILTDLPLNAPEITAGGSY